MHNSFLRIVFMSPFVFSIDGGALPVLSNHSSNIENSLKSRHYTDTNNIPERRGRHLATNTNSCDSDLIERNKTATSYSDVAKKLVMVSRSINDGVNLECKFDSIVDKSNEDDNDKMVKCAESSIDSISLEHNEDNGCTSSMGDKCKINKGDDTSLQTSEGGKCLNGIDQSIDSGTSLITFPYMQVRFYLFPYLIFLTLYKIWKI